MEMHVGLVMGLVKIAVDDVAQERLLDLGRNEIWENQETFWGWSAKTREEEGSRILSSPGKRGW